MSTQPCGCDLECQPRPHYCELHAHQIIQQIQDRDLAADIPYATMLALPEPVVGIGGAPARATTLPVDREGRKQYPVATGVLDYFPDAIVAVAHLSFQGNKQHNPGAPLHWDRTKSTDEADTIIRHFLQRGTLDSDGIRHSAKVAWRALALLQKEIEAENVTRHSDPSHQ